jgi:hypothetical protein
MKTTLSVLIAVSLLFGSAPRTQASTIAGEHFSTPDHSITLANRDCKGDSNDDCK